MGANYSELGLRRHCRGSGCFESSHHQVPQHPLPSSDPPPPAQDIFLPPRVAPRPSTRSPDLATPPPQGPPPLSECCSLLAGSKGA